MHMPATNDGDDQDLWADEPDDDQREATDAGAFAPAEAGVPSSPNKARVFRVKSLDQMVDETDRMARAYYDGDVRKWVKSDETAPFKVRLLLKQLRNLTRVLEELAGEHGWTLAEE
jgi:ParB family chromosome partitioning protein